LPAAISGHQNYFLWGPRDYTGESVIGMQGRQEELEKAYASVKSGRMFPTPIPCRESISTSTFAVG
jgi:hypothetical protein